MGNKDGPDLNRNWSFLPNLMGLYEGCSKRLVPPNVFSFGNRKQALPVPNPASENNIILQHLGCPGLSNGSPSSALETEHRSHWPDNKMVYTPANSGCPSGSRRCLSIHWDHSFLLFCLPPLSLQLKVTHQPQVWARLPDGWNDKASFFFCCIVSGEISYLCVYFPKVLCSWVVGGCFGNWAEFSCLVKSPNCALYFQTQKLGAEWGTADFKC